MKKSIILDTSALIDNPSAYEYYENSDIIIPIIVLGELDKLKKQMNQAGKNARTAVKLIDTLIGNKDLNKGIFLEETNSKLFIDISFRDLKNEKFKMLGDPDYGDTSILACAMEHLEKNPETYLISNDINLRVKAKSVGIKSQSLEEKNVTSEDFYPGVYEVENEEAVATLFEDGSLDPRQYELAAYPHEFINFTDDKGQPLITGRRVSVEKIKEIKQYHPWGIVAKNKEQSLALDLLMDKKVNLCTIIGMAGTGKTLITLAAALELVINKREYDRLIVYRPVSSVGGEIGHLPGTLEEKMAPHFSAIMDSFEVLFSNQGKEWRIGLEMYQKKNKIQLEALTFIRGRSIPRSLIVMDEAQNLSKDEIKTLLTRAGEGTKIVLLGDVEQIDNKQLDVLNNGLSYVINKFKKSSLAGHITLTQGERSALATEAAELL